MSEGAVATRYRALRRAVSVSRTSRQPFNLKPVLQTGDSSLFPIFLDKLQQLSWDRLPGNIVIKLMQSPL